ELLPYRLKDGVIGVTQGRLEAVLTVRERGSIRTCRRTADGCGSRGSARHRREDIPRRELRRMRRWRSFILSSLAIATKGTAASGLWVVVDTHAGGGGSILVRHCSHATRQNQPHQTHRSDPAGAHRAAFGPLGSRCRANTESPRRRNRGREL